MPKIMQGKISHSFNHGISGFTLVELAIVLVIIGLIVGGVLVGQDLIAAAQVNSTVSQIQKYNTAVGAFRLKYGALPGDMSASVAAQFGFTARVNADGQGNNDGILKGWSGASGRGSFESGGETVLFWVDLTAANGLNVKLIPGEFSAATASPLGSDITGSTLDSYFPKTNVGQSNYIYVWSGGYNTVTNNDGINYYGISAVNIIKNTWGGQPGSTPGLTVTQAYNIDSKIDDGLPQSGTVLAMILDGNACGATVACWARGGGFAGPTGTAATTATSITCYDNGNVGGGTQKYSLSQNNGAGLNCGLSFKFQ